MKVDHRAITLDTHTKILIEVFKKGHLVRIQGVFRGFKQEPEEWVFI